MSKLKIEIRNEENKGNIWRRFSGLKNLRIWSSSLEILQENLSATGKKEAKDFNLYFKEYSVDFPKGSKSKVSVNYSPTTNS